MTRDDTTGPTLTRARSVVFRTAQVLLLVVGFVAAVLAATVGARWTASAGSPGGALGRGLLSVVLVLVGLAVLPVVVKWLVAGRFAARDLPVGSFAHLRLWLVAGLLRISPARLLAGTPLYRLYLRAFGTQVGRGAVVATRNMPVCGDLVGIGAGAVVHPGVRFDGYRIDDGVVRTGYVHVGRDAEVGRGAVLDVGTVLGDGAHLAAGAVLEPGQWVEAGVRMAGSPARRVGGGPATDLWASVVRAGGISPAGASTADASVELSTVETAATGAPELRAADTGSDEVGSRDVRPAGAAPGSLFAETPGSGHVGLDDAGSGGVSPSRAAVVRRDPVIPSGVVARLGTRPAVLRGAAVLLGVAVLAVAGLGVSQAVTLTAIPAPVAATQSAGPVPVALLDWLADSADPAATIDAPPELRDRLQRAGVPGERFVPAGTLQLRSASAPGTSDIAFFGDGAGGVVVASALPAPPSTPGAGAALVRNPGLQAPEPVRELLRSGSVDSRALAVLAVLATRGSIEVRDLPTVTGETAAVPLHQVLLSAPDTTTLDWLAAQQPPFAPRLTPGVDPNTVILSWPVPAPTLPGP